MTDAAQASSTPVTPPATMPKGDGGQPATVTPLSPPTGAVLGGRTFPELTGCAHCRAPVQTTNYALGPKLEHYDPDASFHDAVWWHCRLTVATLPGATT